MTRERFLYTCSNGKILSHFPGKKKKVFQENGMEKTEQKNKKIELTTADSLLFPQKVNT